MLQTLNALDTRLFLWLNGINHPWSDEVAWAVSSHAFGGLCILIIAAIFIRYLKMRAVWPIILLLAAMLTADAVSTRCFKRRLQRPRPTREAELADQIHTVRGYTGGRYGFVSSHASNSFAAAAFAVLLVRRRWLYVLAFGLAAAVSYSRIMLGVHYPGDILGGALLGCAIGWAFYRLELCRRKRFPAAARTPR